MYFPSILVSLNVDILNTLNCDKFTLKKALQSIPCNNTCPSHNVFGSVFTLVQFIKKCLPYV